jgi:hypothetical protein
VNLTGDYTWCTKNTHADCGAHAYGKTETHAQDTSKPAGFLGSHERATRNSELPTIGGTLAK